jgi:hypothetical protein
MQSAFIRPSAGERAIDRFRCRQRYFALSSPSAVTVRAGRLVGPFSAKCAISTTLYNSRMSVLRPVLLALAVAMLAPAQQSVSFPAEDGGRICANLYGQGVRAVVLAHGGRFNKESWRD